MAMFLLQLAVFVLSLLLVALALLSAVRNLVLPRSARDGISRIVFSTMRRLFEWRLKLATRYEARDRVMAYYAPVSLLTLLPTWLGLILLGFAGLFWATGVRDPYTAFVLSGSSLFTLGFASDNTPLHMAMAFGEATIGMILVALLIGYLPTMYANFSRREAAVTMLEVRAGSPPTVYDMMLRAHRIGKLHNLTQLWRDWETLFSEIEETHTSLPALVFFRSPDPQHSWVVAAGTIMDSAAFLRSTVDTPPDPQADLCIRAGYLALRRIADFFNIAYSPSPRFPDDPISVTRQEYDAVYDQLLAEGVPLLADREQTWRNFAGWRVNYDRVLLMLCAMTMAPPAPWSSDRAPKFAIQPLAPWLKGHTH